MSVIIQISEADDFVQECITGEKICNVRLRLDISVVFLVARPGLCPHHTSRIFPPLSSYSPGRPGGRSPLPLLLLILTGDLADSQVPPLVNGDIRVFLPLHPLLSGSLCL